MIIHPDTPAKKCWDFLILLQTLLLVFYLPFKFSFQVDDDVFSNLLDVVVDVSFLLDISNLFNCLISSFSYLVQHWFLQQRGFDNGQEIDHSQISERMVHYRPAEHNSRGMGVPTK